MRIVALSTSYPKGPHDSTAPFLRAISRGLARDDWELDLLLPAHPELAWNGADPPVRVHTFSYAPSSLPSLHLWGYAGALRADVRLRPAVALVVAPALVSATRALGRLARRVHPDVIHAHWVLPNGPPAAWVAGRLEIPLAISLHGSGTFLAERRGVFGKAARWAFRRAAVVTACSRDLMERAVALGAPRERCRVIPYGADPERFRPATPEERAVARGSLDMAGDALVVAAVGRLVEKKGFRYLLDAAARIPSDLRPLIVVGGGGDLADDLGRRARERGLGDGVRFLGDLDRDRVRALYRAADILAVPSVVDSAGNVDGLPNVLLEGLASGLPVVASRVAGIPDVLRDGENGLLAPPREPEALAAALTRLCADPDLRARLGARARRSVEERLNWTAVTGRYREALKDAAARGADPVRARGGSSATGGTGGSEP